MPSSDYVSSLCKLPHKINPILILSKFNYRECDGYYWAKVVHTRSNWLFAGKGIPRSRFFRSSWTHMKV